MTETSKIPSKYVEADRQLSDRARALIGTDGIDAAARTAGVSPCTLAKIVARLPVHHSILDGASRRLGFAPSPSPNP